MVAKKLMAMAMTAVMTAALLAGCGEESQNGTAPTAQVSENAGNNAETNNGGSENSAGTQNNAGAETDKKDNGSEAKPEANAAPEQTENNAGSDAEDTVKEPSGAFAITGDESVAAADTVYTITKGGEYNLTGILEEGQIRVNVSEEEEVTLVLNAVSITSKKDSVIYVDKADKVTIKAQKGTMNTLTDSRVKKVSEDDTLGSGCIYSKADLNFSGKGYLVVNATYNNGIHSKDDIKIKNLNLTVTAANNAIKGNDSITIESGVINVTSTDGDGLKTTSTKVSSKGKQKGYITIESGTVNIVAYDDCIKAAMDVIIAENEDTVVTQKSTKIK